MYVEMCHNVENHISKWNQGTEPTVVPVDPVDYPNLVQYLKDTEENKESSSIQVIDIGESKKVCFQITADRFYEQDVDKAVVVCCVDNGGQIEEIPAAVKTELETLNALV